MARVPLIGQSYAGQSVIASAQQAINVYAESNAENPLAPTPITYYPTPGTVLFADAPANNHAKIRCAYRTTIGTAYVVIGPLVYFLTSAGALVYIGGIQDSPSQVYMADNGLAVVLVDGSGLGYAINMANNAFGLIIDPSFYGADFVVFLDTFFVFNRPNTNQFYISLSTVDYALLTAGNSFDPLDIAAKAGSADPIVGIMTIHRELWLIGELTTEVWIGTGAADFFFQQQQGAYIDHGCIAPYSIANQDIIGFWLMQDRQGKNIIVSGGNYQVSEISTPDLVKRFNSYETTDDAIGFCFQIRSHAFYCLTFPTANKTWLYELKTKQWCEWNWFNADTDTLNRHRANCCMYVFKKNIIGDWENGKLYQLDADVYTDNNGPIFHLKTFNHMVGDDFQRIIYNSLDADVEVGTQNPADTEFVFDPDGTGSASGFSGGFSGGFGPNNMVAKPPEIFLSWSDNRGVSYGFPVGQTLGLGGEYLTTVSWNRLGMARDRVFKLTWTAAVKIALNGAFVDSRPART